MHLAALTADGKKIFPRLSAFPKFYLGGGTALALQIGHRVSEDFDFFSDKPIARNQLNLIEKTFKGITVRPTVNNRDELTVFAGKVKVTFLHYPFPVVRGLVSYRKLRLLSIPEIAATKAYTIGRRGTLKDYVDIFFAMESGISLRTIVSLAEKKYADAFNARLFFEQLLFLEDVEDVPIHFLKRRVGKNTLSQFFSSAIRAFTL